MDIGSPKLITIFLEHVYKPLSFPMFARCAICCIQLVRKDYNSLMLICVVSARMYVGSKMHQEVDLLGDSIVTTL